MLYPVIFHVLNPINLDWYWYWFYSINPAWVSIQTHICVYAISYYFACSEFYQPWYWYWFYQPCLGLYINTYLCLFYSTLLFFMFWILSTLIDIDISSILSTLLGSPLAGLCLCSRLVFPPHSLCSEKMFRSIDKTYKLLVKWKKRTENISRQINLEVRVHLCLHLADPAGLENHGGHHLHPLLLSSHPPSVCLYLCVCTEFVCLLFEYLKLQFWFFSCQSSSIPT